MYSRNRTKTLVHQQDGNAVGGLDRDHRTRSMLNKRVASAEFARSAAGEDAIRRVNLLQGGKVAVQRGNVNASRAEAVDQPRKRVELSHPVDMPRIFVEHYAGF